MANEFRHGTVGTELTQTEYESITGHSFDSQATGDIVYASSATQLRRLAIGSTNDFSQVVSGIPAWVSNPVITDNNQLRLGTGGDSSLYYDGTDSFWDLRRVGTGDLMIALAGSFPSPDAGAVHVWSGTAGAVAAATGARFVVESSNTTQHVFQLLAPNSAVQDIFFGSPASNGRGFIGYHGSTDTPADTLRYGTAATTRLLHSSGEFAFQQATNIDVQAGSIQLTERSAPGAGAANTVRIYAVVDGGTLTDLAAVFQDGTVDLFAQEV